MVRFNESIHLDEVQTHILKSFIQRFLPKRGNRRKHSGNEIEYVSNTLNRVMKQNFGFNLSKRNILDVFETLQYDIFTKNGDWNCEIKEFRPSNTGSATRGGDGYTDYNAMYIYIDIEALAVRDLKLASITLPPNAGDDKILLRKKIKDKIDSFTLEMRSN